MNKILEDFSTESLKKAIRANMLGCLEYLGRSPRAVLYDSPELKWMLTGIKHVWINNVLYTHLEPDQADLAIEETTAHFQAKNSPYFSWWVEPDAQPTALGSRLEAHGFTLYAGSLGMAVDLLALNEDTAAPSGLTIEAVRDEKLLAQWIEPFFFGFGGFEGFNGTDERAASFELYAGLGFDLPMRSYIGWLDGKPAAASQLFLGAGVAGVYCVATIPEARGKGIGAKMTLAPLLEAREMGYRIGVLQATPMGENVYRRLGFGEYGRLPCYLMLG